MASANSLRSSPMRMDSVLQPITSTPYLDSTPASSSSMAQLRPVWPPMLGSRASGRSRSMTLATESAVMGST